MNSSLRALFAAVPGDPRERWKTLSVCLLAFCMPLAPLILPLLMVLVIATHLIDPTVWRWKPLQRGSFLQPAPWLIGFFLLHVIGMAWSTNTDFGWFDIGIKLPLLLLPVLAIWPGMRTHAREAVFFSFCAGSVLTVLLCVVLACARALSADGQGMVEFLSSTFSVTMHPSYFAWYLSTALVMFFLGGLRERLPHVAGLLFVLTACVGLVLTQSRMGWITLPLVLLAALLHAWRDRWWRGALGAIIVSSVLSGVVLTIVSPNVRDRVTDLFAAVHGAQADTEGSAAIRTVVWGAAWDVAMYNLPWGTGTGDVKDELLLRYKEIGAVHAEERKLNAHNQFLQSFAALGVLGAALLLLAMLVPLLAAFMRGSEDRILRIAALVLLALNLSVESMLEVQAGALFAGFLLWLLWWPRAAVSSSHP